MGAVSCTHYTTPATFSLRAAAHEHADWLKNSAGPRVPCTCLRTTSTCRHLRSRRPRPRKELETSQTMTPRPPRSSGASGLPELTARMIASRITRTARPQPPKSERRFRSVSPCGELRQAAGAATQAPWLSRIEPSRHTADLNVRKYRLVEFYGRLYHVAREASFEAKAQGQSRTSVGCRWVVIVAGERSLRSN